MTWACNLEKINSTSSETDLKALENRENASYHQRCQGLLTSLADRAPVVSGALVVTLL
jgi:hypothetical protein